ncbi:MAG: glutathione S-transferase family protein [Rhizobiales bacterium]|nr:glutathione S-transferase family protein [Hyphomicrobiales bacterium]MBI3673001.1 glutathione S-transferase family protein [Hyphomicrobiales bacterium]
MPSLIHFALDPFSRRMRLALAEYGVAVDLIDEPPWEPSPDLFALNPAGTLPILVEDGATAICGIEAIGEYLEESVTGKVRLIPGDVKGRAEVRRLVGWFDTKFYAEVSEPVLTEKVIRRFLPREAGGGAPDMARVRLAMTKLRHHLDYVGQLADYRAWLAGGKLSLADLAGAAHLSVIDFFGDVPWADYPVAKSWYQRLKSRPSFRPLLADTVRGLQPPPAYADLDF